MGVHRSRTFVVLFMSLSVITQVFGQQSPSLPSASRLPSWLPSGIPQTASGKPIRCSLKNTKLNPSTHKLISECGAQAFCLAAPGTLSNSTGQGVCVSRSCRGDQYPYGYARFGGQSGGAAEVPWTIVKGKPMPVGDDDERLQSMLPPMCHEGSFCPDRGSGCQPKVESGGACELGRDEQCRNPPTNEKLPAGSLNRAVCLNSKCVFVPLFLDFCNLITLINLPAGPPPRLSTPCAHSKISPLSPTSIKVSQEVANSHPPFLGTIACRHFSSATSRRSFQTGAVRHVNQREKLDRGVILMNSARQ
jgi:hypothetical protein